MPRLNAVAVSAPPAPEPSSPPPPPGIVPPLDLPAELRDMIDPEAYEAEGRRSTGPVDNSRILAADRYITGNLETGINSQIDGTAGGPLVIQTSRDVYGYHGRNVLIPKGSRLICQYKAPEDMGSSRLEVRCGRVLLGGTRAEIFQLKASLADQQGRLGLTGNIDTRFEERYGTAFALAGISATVRMAAASTATTSESEASMSDSLTTGAEELSQKLGEISASTLEQTLDLKPIITIAQGTRITIRPTYDWYIKPVSAGDSAS